MGLADFRAGPAQLFHGNKGFAAFLAACQILCRRLDPDVRTLPRESSPASLENWALRRKTLKPGQVEKHLGLDDVKLMLRTMQAEFKKRKLFPGMRDKKK